MSKPDDDDEKKFDVNDESKKRSVSEVDLLREAVREHGKKLGELENRFDRMDDHLADLSGLVKSALKELRQIDTRHEKTTEKPK